MAGLKAVDGLSEPAPALELQQILAKLQALELQILKLEAILPPAWRNAADARLALVMALADEFEDEHMTVIGIKLALDDKNDRDIANLRKAVIPIARGDLSKESERRRLGKYLAANVGKCGEWMLERVSTDLGVAKRGNEGVYFRVVKVTG